MFRSLVAILWYALNSEKSLSKLCDYCPPDPITNVISTQDVFSTMGASDIDAVGVTISNMGSMETIFDVVGEGSTAMVMNLAIEDNDFSSIVPPIRWTAITIRDNASARFVDTVVSNSTNIRHVFSASVNSNLDILRAEMTSLTGGRAVVS